MGQEYYPSTIITQNNAGEWHTYTVIQQRCGRGSHRMSMFVQTGRMIDDGIEIPLSQDMYHAFGFELWQDYPTALSLNFTYSTGHEGLTLTGIVYNGEFYSLT